MGRREVLFLFSSHPAFSRQSFTQKKNQQILLYISAIIQPSPISAETPSPSKTSVTANFANDCFEAKCHHHWSNGISLASSASRHFVKLKIRAEQPNIMHSTIQIFISQFNSQSLLPQVGISTVIGKAINQKPGAAPGDLISPMLVIL